MVASIRGANFRNVRIGANSTPPPSTQIFLDNFVASNGTLISARSPDIGGSWVKDSGAGASYNIDIQSNKALITADGNWTEYYATFSAPVVSDTYVVRTQMILPASVGGPSERIDSYVTIYQDAPTFFAAPIVITISMNYDGTDTAYAIETGRYGSVVDNHYYEVVNPSASVLGNTVNFEGVCINGTDFYLYINSVLVGQFVSASASEVPLTVGLYQYLSTGLSLSNAIRVENIEVLTV
jgi:hypothetical protein